MEYLSREDAERAVKELDGRDLRGQPVRVAMDREVSPRRLFLVWDIQLMSYCSVLEAMIIVVNLVATIVVTIVTLGMIAPAMTVTAMTATAGMTVATAGNAPGRLLAAPKPMIVAPPGLHLPGGIMMIEGLQGTMTGEVAMMTEEALILTMTAAGTTTDAGMIAVGTRGTIATMTGPRGTPTGKADGRAEIGLWFSGFHPFVVVAREMVSRMASWTASRRIGSAVWKRSRVSRARRISRDRVTLRSMASGLPPGAPLPFAPVLVDSPRYQLLATRMAARPSIGLR